MQVWREEVLVPADQRIEGASDDLIAQGGRRYQQSKEVECILRNIT